MSSQNWSYEYAIQKFRSLPSRAFVRQRAVQNHANGIKCPNIEETENVLQRIGIPLSKLDDLRVIHIAGTKGKGTTSAMCESILRHHGFRTGLYASPHLIYERERIRINGRPISEEDFARHFQRVWQLLQDTQENETVVPNFCSFIVSMAFYVFLLEKVDVAVIETGCGGVVDFTNVVRNVPVVGITSLELDHTNILGNTLAEITAAKAGIMKRGCEAYTVQQPTEAMDVLTATADYLKCPLTVVPEYTSYIFPESKKPVLAVDVPTNRINASLAIQLTQAWMRLRNDNTLVKMLYEVPYETVEGLRQLRWAGRYHIVEEKYAKIFVDGAHTKESSESCAKWFLDNTDNSSKKIMIYNTSPDRNAEAMFRAFNNIVFQEVYFVVPSNLKQNTSLDEQQLFYKYRQYYAQFWYEYYPETKVTILERLAEAFDCIKKKGGRPSVLITGSYTLAGEAVAMLDPKSVLQSQASEGLLIVKDKNLAKTTIRNKLATSSIDSQILSCDAVKESKSINCTGFMPSNDMLRRVNAKDEVPIDELAEIDVYLPIFD